MTLTKEDVLKAENERIEAFKNKDMATLDRLLHDDMIYIHHWGRRDQKPSLLQRVMSHTYQSIDRDDLEVRTFGDSAFMTGSLKMRIASPGEDLREVVGFVSQVWVKSGTGVSLLSYHVSKFKPAE